MHFLRKYFLKNIYDGQNTKGLNKDRLSMEKQALEKPGARQMWRPQQQLPMIALYWLPKRWVNFEEETGILDQGESKELPLTITD